MTWCVCFRLPWALKYHHLQHETAKSHTKYIYNFHHLQHETVTMQTKIYTNFTISFKKGNTKLLKFIRKSIQIAAFATRNCYNSYENLYKLYHLQHETVKTHTKIQTNFINCNTKLLQMIRKSIQIASGSARRLGSRPHLQKTMFSIKKLNKNNASGSARRLGIRPDLQKTMISIKKINKNNACGSARRLGPRPDLQKSMFFY